MMPKKITIELSYTEMDEVLDALHYMMGIYGYPNYSKNGPEDALKYERLLKLYRDHENKLNEFDRKKKYNFKVSKGDAYVLCLVFGSFLQSHDFHHGINQLVYKLHPKTVASNLKIIANNIGK